LLLITQRYNFPQWLVEDANSMFVGINDGYIDFVDTRLTYTISTKIHHVESWGSFSENVKWSAERASFYRSAFRSAVEEETEYDYRRKTIQWGRNASLGFGIT
jgi:hypothetical protein